MAVGKGSLKRLNTAAKLENEKKPVQMPAAEQLASNRLESGEVSNKQLNESFCGSISKITCVLPDYLL